MSELGIVWGAAPRVVWVPLVVIVIGMVMYRAYCVNKIARYLAGTAHRNRVLFGFSSTKNYIKAVLFMLGSLFLFLAFLEPQWHKKEQTVEQKGRDLFIALDVSRSMLVQDCLPDRLSCAKKKIKTLLNHLSCERVGLILFSGSTFVQCPLTTDYGAVYMFLDQIDVETISSGTTAIDEAIKQALTAFNMTPDRKNRLLVVFTDGEDFSSNLAGVKQEAAQAGMHIFTVGVGTTQGAPVPLYDVHGKQIGHQLNKSGGVVISQLNEPMLRSLALDSGGTYIKMTHDDTDVKSIVASVARFEKERFNDKKVAMFEQQYPYFVAVSFICFVLEWLI